MRVKVQTRDMNQELSLLTILMDKKTHYREELLQKIYKARNGVQSGRLAARVNDLRKRGYEVDSPFIRYVKGKKVRVKVENRLRADKEFWYRLRGTKTEWKKLMKSKQK